MRTTLLCAAFLVLIVLVLCMLSRNSKSAGSDSGQMITKLMQECLHKSTLALQDTNPLIEMKHSVEAMALLQCCRALVSDRLLERVSGVDIQKLQKKCAKSEQSATQKVRQRMNKQVSTQRAGTRLQFLPKRA